MKENADTLLPVPESVREDVLAYRERLSNRLAALHRGETNAAALRAFRVPMGIYEQRTDGQFMVRVRVGAGLVLAGQVRKIAALGKRYGNGKLHFTTRQDIQIHDAALEDTPNILEGLLEVGLTSRGGGGNTLRNVTACPRAGRCPHERFNAAPEALDTAARLLQQPSSFNLPRKYKIAFSGCANDCALASIADCGFIAQVHGGRKGFKVFAGGGLGMHPRAAVEIAQFIGQENATAMSEAVRRVFDRHGDRANRHRARLRYVLERMGAEAFRALCLEHYTAVLEEAPASVPAFIPDLEARFAPLPETGNTEKAYPPVPETSAHLVLEEKYPSTVTLRLPLPLGNISANDLESIALLSEVYGIGLLVATQHQEVHLPGVQRIRLDGALAAFQTTGLAEHLSGPRPLFVSCAGASTCKLGLCLSRSLAQAIVERLEHLQITGDGDTPVTRISGCPNSCGGHQAGALGLEGRAQRHNGRLMPMYAVLAGGKTSETGARLATALGVVPAQQIPDMMAEVFRQNAADPEHLQALVSEYARIPDEPPESWYYDHGTDAPFSLAGRGPGECGAGVFEVIQMDMREASYALRVAAKAKDRETRANYLYQALVAGTRALLPVFGIDMGSDREIFDNFDRELVVPGWISRASRTLITTALNWKLGDNPDGLIENAGSIAQLIQRVSELYESLDASLKFKLAPLRESPDTMSRAQDKGTGMDTAVEPHTPMRLDLRNVRCPMNFVKAKVALEKMPVEAVLEVVLDGGEPIRNVPASFSEQGQEVLAIEPFEDQFLLRLQRKR